MEVPSYLKTDPPLCLKNLCWPSFCVCECMRGKSFVGLTLCDPVNHSLPGPSVQGILQARIMEWVATPSSRGSSLPKDRTHVPYIFCVGRWAFYHQYHLGSPLTLFNIYSLMLFFFIVLHERSTIILTRSFSASGYLTLRIELRAERKEGRWEDRVACTRGFGS